MLKPIRKAFKRAVRRSLGLSETTVKKPSYGLDPLEDIIRLADELGRRIEIVFDVGAHYGATSAFFAEHCPHAKIYAFEPHGPSCAVFRRNIVSDAVNVFNLALSDHSGQAEFHEFGKESTLNSLEAHAPYPVRFNRKSETRIVDVDTVDAFCEKKCIRSISVLKVDTEGHDLSVMRGASRLFERRAIDFVLFEFTNFGTLEGTQGGSLNELGEFLDRYDFQFVATYTDYIVPKKGIFVVANGLAVRR